MNSYSPHLFRKLDVDEEKEFQQFADVSFDTAEDEIEIKAVTHPVYRMQLAKRIYEHAEEDLRKMST